MWKTKRTAMMLALGMLLVLFSTAFAAAPAQASGSRTASAPTTSQQLQFGWSGWGEVPGNGFTVSGPATTYNRKRLRVCAGYQRPHLPEQLQWHDMERLERGARPWAHPVGAGSRDTYDRTKGKPGLVCQRHRQQDL